MFISKEFKNFATNMGFKLLNSSPYYAEANGQAEASNQTLIKLIKKKIIDQPRKCHLMLNESLWAYRMACHSSTKCSPYELVYGHTTVLPWKIRTRSRRIEFQESLRADDYKVLMMDDLEDLNFHRLRALENIEAHKLRIAKYYDKNVKSK
jgi:transposase